MKKLLFVFILCAIPARAQIAITASQGSGSTGTLTLATFTYSAPMTNPSVLVVHACGRGAITIADTGAHAWNEVTNITYNTNRQSHMWYANNTSATAPTVTVTNGGGLTFIQGIGIEITGLLTSLSLDAVGSATANATSITPTSAAVAQASEIVIGGGCSFEASRTWTVDAASSVVLMTGLNGFSSAITRLTAVTGLSGTQSIQEIISGAAAQIGGVIGTFKQAASGIVGPKHKIVDH